MGLVLTVFYGFIFQGVDVGGKKKMRYRQRGVLEIDIPKSEAKNGVFCWITTYLKICWLICLPGMYRVFVMYVVESGNTNKSEYPELKLEVAESGKYPVVVLGYTGVESVGTVIKDRRSIYNKFKHHNRYYKEYMEVFRYCERSTTGVVDIHELATADNKASMMDLLFEYVIKYKFFYGDRCSAREYILKIESMNISVGVKKVVEVPVVLTSAEKRKISRKRYEDSVRDSLREKSRNYYSLNKDSLSEKRRLKRLESKQVTKLGNNPILKKLDSIDE